MERVQSHDGTKIAVTRSGVGPPVVIVHGAVMGSIAWGMVASLLAPHFSVYAIDRRGYGESGDTTPYAVEREMEDIVAVLDSIGEPAALHGHSSGAILSLMVAERGQSLRRLMLYEPPLFTGGHRPRPPMDLPERLDALLAAGDRKMTLATFLHEAVGAPDAEIEQMLQHDTADQSSKMMIANAHAVPHDARIATTYTPDAARLRSIQTPTLLLLGSASPRWVHADTELLAASLPDNRVVTMPGQDHIANVTAPDLLAHAITHFLEAPL